MEANEKFAREFGAQLMGKQTNCGPVLGKAEAIFKAQSSTFYPHLPQHHQQHMLAWMLEAKRHEEPILLM